MSPATGATTGPDDGRLAGTVALTRGNVPTPATMAAAATLLLIAAPWRSGGEGAALVHLTPADAGSVVLVALVAVRALTIPTLTDERRMRSWVTLPLLALLAAAAAATITAADAMLSLSGMVRTAQLYVVVPLATYLALRRRADLALLLSAVLVLGVIEAAIAIAQYATGSGASYAGEEVRAVGTFGAYSIMALPWVLTAALIVATSVALAYRGWVRAVALVAVAVLVPGLAFSLSRGFWLAAAVSVLATVAVHDRAKAVALLVGSLVLLSAAPVLLPGSTASPVVERLGTGASALEASDQSVRDRYALWDAALGMWRDNPATGVGIKSFPRYRDSYIPFGSSGASDIGDAQGGFRQVALLSPHNTYLLVLAEQGAVGAAAFAAYFGGLGWAALRRVRRDIRRDDDPLVVAFGLAVIGLLAAFLVSALHTDPGGSTVLLNGTIHFGGLLWLAAGAQVAEETPA